MVAELVAPRARSRVVRLLVAIAVSFVVLYLVTKWIGGASGWAPAQRLATDSPFDLDDEVSVPTWWAQIQLAGAAALAVTLAAMDPTRRHAWGAAAATLVVLSIDEGASLHERLIEPTRELFEIDGGPLDNAWVIPAGVAVVAAVVAGRRLWVQLPRPARRWSLVGVVVFVVGAVGCEAFGAELLSRGVQEGPYLWAVAAEEGLELLGVVCVIHALLLTMAAHASGEHHSPGAARAERPAIPQARPR